MCGRACAASSLGLRVLVCAAAAWLSLRRGESALQVASYICLRRAKSRLRNSAAAREESGHLFTARS